LNISVELNHDCVLIKNNKKEKKQAEESTGIGLKNLKSRYLLFCKKSITIEDTGKEYIIKLPLIHQNV
jgi:two-component system, LytTR family, sensor kinase